jgi:hypothetical protein
MKIKFKTLIPEAIHSLKKIKPTYFEWFNKAIEDYKKNKFKISTAKCPGIISVLNTGWVQYTYQDIRITTFGNKTDFKWDTPINQKQTKYGEFINDYVSYHTPEQFAKYKNIPKNTLNTLIKIQSPWVVYIPKGYQLLVMPVAYNDVDIFSTSVGFLKNFNFLNVQLQWKKINGSFTIKKGTPLAQYILVKDNSILEKITTVNDLDIKNVKKHIDHSAEKYGKEALNI